MHKDLQLAALPAFEQGLALRAGYAAKEIYTLAIRAGLGEQDFAAIYKFLNG